MYISYLSDENTMFCFAIIFMRFPEAISFHSYAYLVPQWRKHDVLFRNELVRKVTKKNPRELVGLHDEVNLSCSSSCLHGNSYITISKSSGFNRFMRVSRERERKFYHDFECTAIIYTKYIEDFGFKVLPPSLYLNVERLLSFEKKYNVPPQLFIIGSLAAKT
jgi:hypothetical protein